MWDKRTFASAGTAGACRYFGGVLTQVQRGQNLGASNKKMGSGAQRQTPLLKPTAANRTVSPRGDIDLNRGCVHQKKLGSAERFSSIQTKQK
jgi:hypothetical protein